MMTEHDDKLELDMTEDTEDFEPAFDELVRGAYEAIDPSPEAEERMLANILAAQRAKDTAAGDTSAETAEVASPSLAPVTPLPSKPARKRSSHTIRILLPVAATVLVGAVAVGVIMSSVGENKAAGIAASPAQVDMVSDNAAREANELGDYATEDMAVDADEYSAFETTGYTDSALDASSMNEPASGSMPNPPSYYPVVVLPNGEEFELVFENGAPVTLPQQERGEMVGDATAWNDARTDSLPCTVYHRSGNSSEFVINYGDATYFLARKA